jgi:hypothetical protein
MERDWIPVYSSTALHSAELLKHMLHEKGIDAIVLNKKDSTYQTFGHIEILVKRDQVIPAKRIIAESEL